MWVLDGPQLTVPRASLVAGPDWAARPELVTIPVPVFLVEHRAGLVLFDTGLAPEAAEDPAAALGEAASRARLRFTPGQRADRQLRAYGFAPRDITHVVVSHLHFDHAGGLGLFPGATWLLGRGELAAARTPGHRYYRAEDTRRAGAGRITEVHAAEHDLFGDGSVVLLRTPGHTAGSLSMLVVLGHRAVILAGDAVHHRDAFDRELAFPRDQDPRAAVASIRRLKRIARRSGASVLISHHADNWNPGPFG
jgi:glyoxylase-like metal-dependent hydrolase (beta-lactamase superfamily II)